MINWLNSNAGAITALLTLVYVIATLVIVCVMVGANRLTRKNIETMITLEKERARPHVLFDIVPIKFSPHITIVNIGQTPAYDVRIEITPKPQSIRGVVGDQSTASHEWADIPFLEKGIAFLCPGREVQAFLAPFRSLREKYTSLVFEGHVTYRDGDKKSYTDPFRIDLGFHEGICSYREKEVGSELEKIGKSIEKFHGIHFRPLVRTISEQEYREQQDKHVVEAQKTFEESEPSRG